MSVQRVKIAESTLLGFSSDLYFYPPLLSLSNYNGEDGGGGGDGDSHGHGWLE